MEQKESPQPVYARDKDQPKKYKYLFLFTNKSWLTIIANENGRSVYGAVDLIKTKSETNE